MLMYSRPSFLPIVSRDQYTTIVFIQRTLNINPPIHRAVLYRPLYISVYRLYIIPNVNLSIMLSGPFHTFGHLLNAPAHSPISSLSFLKDGMNFL